MKMNKIRFAIFLIAALILVVSVVHADLECRISNVQLNGQGANIEVDPGETIELSFDYEIWEPLTVVPISAQQIVIGLERTPLYCAYHGCPGGYPEVTNGQSQFTMTAPTELGTYVIRWMPTIQPTPGDAKDAYRNNPSLGYGMAEITVTEPDKQGICGRVYNVNLNNQGNYLEVCTNEAFTVDLDYDIWCWVPGNSRRQIIVGIDDKPCWSVYNGVPPEKPGSSGHSNIKTKISNPGTYTLSYMITFCDNAGDGMARYMSRPDLREKIGTIKVTDCGNRELHCEVQYLDLNGQGNHLVINPGETIRMCAYYSVWNSDEYPNNRQQILVGLDDNFLFCAYDGVPGTYPGISNQDALHTFNAPTEPGTYNVEWMCTTDYLRNVIGSITVIADQDWRCINSKTLPEAPFESTNISIFQRGNDLLVQINDSYDDLEGTLQWPDVRSGSVTISVPESIDINYSSSNVTGLLLWETDYKQINRREVSLIERSLLFVAGLLGGTTGMVIGVTQFTKDVVPDDVDWYAKNDTYHLSPEMFFEQYDMLNTRDNVVIPWYISLTDQPAYSIRVHCPKMDFPHPGIYNIVFRVDYKYELLEVRYDVALPITVT